jgi:hypothetical protein
MKNQKADVRISVRRGDGKTQKIELFPHPLPGRYAIKVDGLKSGTTITTTITEVMHRLREWLSTTRRNTND